MGELGVVNLIIIALAALWVGIAAAVAIVAARRLRLAEDVLDIAKTHARLLELAPARPLLVRPDQSVEIDRRLARDLGLGATPVVAWAELGAGDRGFEPEYLEALAADLDKARSTASSFARKVRAAGSSRVFDVRGAPAPDEPPGTMLLWAVEISALHEERSGLELRLRQTEVAVGSLTQLIAAAPFPMWLRGPDLKLGLVNSAFVQTVE